MYRHIYIYLYICLRAYIHMYIYIYLCICVYMHVHIYACMYISHTHIYRYILAQSIFHFIDTY